MRAAPRRAFAVAALLLAPAVHVAPVLPDPYPGAARAYLLAIDDEPVSYTHLTLPTNREV